MELIDPVVREYCPITEVMRCIHIRLLCVQEDPADRPITALVVIMLSSNSPTLPLPQPLPLPLPPSVAHRAEPQKTAVELDAPTMGSVESNVRIITINEIIVSELDSRW